VLRLNGVNLTRLCARVEGRSLVMGSGGGGGGRKKGGTPLGPSALIGLRGQRSPFNTQFTGLLLARPVKGK